MLVLAMDLSSRQGSLAVLQDSQVLSERTWELTRAHNQQFFQILREGLAQAQVDPASLGLLAVGLGPGSFSGIRMALTAARALALPGHQTVAGISSSKALAWPLLEQPDAGAVTVLGDARRGRLWAATYARSESFLEQPDVFALMSPDEASRRIPEGSVVVSPDWSRVKECLSRRLSGHTRIIEEDAYPRAQTVGHLLLRRAVSGRSPELLTPIYLHPPVDKPPRAEGPNVAPRAGKAGPAADRWPVPSSAE
jgi:tRNA threonylcarbamoyl adenosine modification protein YeaZ